MSCYPKTGGPIPKFKDYHLWKTLNCLKDGSSIGRKSLALKLNIGEGSTRTILNKLQKNNLININKNGVNISLEGLEVWNSVYMELKILPVNDLTIGEINCVIRIPNASQHVEYGCEERDCAIKAGATGATTLIFSNGALIFPGSNYLVESKINNIICKNFKLKNNDVLIIGTANDEETAENGAITAGLELIGGIHIQHDLDNLLTQKRTGNEIVALAFAIHDLIGGLPVCAKSKNNLGVRIESGKVIDNAYTGQVLEEAISTGTTVRKIATSGPYKGIKVIVTPVELNNKIVGAIGVVDIRTMAGIDNLIRLEDDNSD